MDVNKGKGQKSPCLRNNEISERLLKERQEAIKLLESKSKKTNKLLSTMSTAKPATTFRAYPVNKENLSSNVLHVPNRDNFAAPKAVSSLKKVNSSNMSAKHTFHESTQTNTELNKTEYVPRKYHEPHDVSELLLLDSITLSGSSMTPPKELAPNVSFNPSEMTGRSTLHKHDSKRGNLLTLDEILMKSTVPRVRERRKSSMGCAASERNSVASSCISNFSAMQKNPRPTSSLLASSFVAAANLNNQAGATQSFNGDNVEFSFGADMQQARSSAFNDESFTPAELMQSRLANDEIDWAQQKLPIPTAKLLSKEAQAKLAAKGIFADSFNTTANSNATFSAFNNGDITRFFQLRSEEIGNIVHASSPPRDRRAAPVALISDDTVSTTSNANNSHMFELTFADQEASLVSKTPAIDERTYDKTTAGPIGIEVEIHEIHDSKDSGNGSGKSTDPLVYAGCDKALAKTACDATVPTMNNEQSGEEPLNGFVSALVGTATAAQSGNSLDFLKQAEQLQFETEKVLENKENIEAFNKNMHFDAGSTTLSFTDSLLNTSIQNYRMSSVGQARAPLSPIPIVVTELRHGDEADIDEFTNSPRAQNRRKRYSKSPSRQPKSENSNAAKSNDFILMDETDDAQNLEMQKETKQSMKNNAATENTTNVGVGEDKSASDSNSVYSPNFSKVNKTLTPTRTNGVSGVGKPTFELSPLASPRSYLSSPLGSLSGCQCSPNFDHTTHSDQRYLSPTMTNGLRRVSSSPCASVASAPTVGGASNKYGSGGGYGAPPVRTYSSNSVKSIESNSTRSASRCSNNSEYSHRDGRILPLKATALELSWGSVKLHKGTQKSLQIRNTSGKRLGLRVLTFGPGFQLVSPDSNLITLTSQECRTIVINFCPTVVGPAIGKLSLQQPRPMNNSNNNCNSNSNGASCNELAIPLYAYGGHASIFIQNILKGPLNVPFFPIGDLCDLIQPLEGEIRIHNKGPLLGFAFVDIEPSGALHVPGLCSAFSVHPACTLIAPNTVATVKIVFAPRRDDLKKIKKLIGEVFTLAKMRIIYGDEAMRQRLRKIHNEISMNVKRRERQFGKSLDKLWTRIPGEYALDGLEGYKEETTVAEDIWSCLSEQEAAITLNNNMQDETAAELSTIFSEADNTILFRTVCGVPSPTTHLETLHEHHEEAHEQTAHHAGECASATVSSSTSGSGSGAEDDGNLLFAVQPTSVEFDFRSERVPIVVRNNYEALQYFTIACNHPDLLYFEPSHGYIEPKGGQLTVAVHAHPAARKQQQRIPNDINIMVYMDGKKILVPVRVPAQF